MIERTNGEPSALNWGDSHTKNKGPDFLEEKGEFLKEINNIYICKKYGKFYAYNTEGKNVFLKGVTEHKDGNDFIFEKIDGKLVLIVYYSGKNEYFLENGEHYYPKNTTTKIAENLKDIVQKNLNTHI